MKKLFFVIGQSGVTPLSSQKSENGILYKRTLVLQELGGKYADTYVCSVLGDDAQKEFTPKSVVAASLRFTAHQYDDKWYQDIVADQVVELSTIQEG